VWWDLRPQPRIGTLEVRVMDAQPSLARVAAMTALLQGLTRHVVEFPDPVDLPDDVLAANDHRALRHGLDTTVVGIDGSSAPLRLMAARAVAQARSALRPEGLDGPLDVVDAMLATTPEPERQRLLCRQHGMPALLSDLCARTISQED
jgi:glutamate---cysteine ligase / carboxylate-amine ligase